MTKNFPKVFLIFVLPLLVALGLASCANSEQTGSVSFAVTPELARFVSAANASLEFDALLEDGTQLDNQEKTYTITVSLSGGYTDSQTKSFTQAEWEEIESGKSQKSFEFDAIPAGVDLTASLTISEGAGHLVWPFLRGEESMQIKEGPNTAELELHRLARVSVYNNTESGETLSSISNIRVYALKKGSEAANAILALVAKNDDANDKQIYETLLACTPVGTYQNPTSPYFADGYELKDGDEVYMLSLVITASGDVYLGHPDFSSSDTELADKALTTIKINEINQINLVLMKMKLGDELPAFFPTSYADKTVAAWYKCIANESSKLKTLAIFLFDDGTFIETKYKKSSDKEEKEVEVVGSYTLTTSGNYTTNTGTATFGDTTMEITITNGVLKSNLFEESFTIQSNSSVPSPTDPVEPQPSMTQYRITYYFYNEETGEYSPDGGIHKDVEGELSDKVTDYEAFANAQAETIEGWELESGKTECTPDGTVLRISLYYRHPTATEITCEIWFYLQNEGATDYTQKEDYTATITVASSEIGTDAYQEKITNALSKYVMRLYMMGYTMNESKMYSEEKDGKMIIKVYFDYGTPPAVSSAYFPVSYKDKTVSAWYATVSSETGKYTESKISAVYLFADKSMIATTYKMTSAGETVVDFKKVIDVEGTYTLDSADNFSNNKGSAVVGDQTYTFAITDGEFAIDGMETKYYLQKGAAPIPTLKGISVKGNSASVAVGGTLTLTATAVYSNGEMTSNVSDFNWVSSSSAATVKDGVVTGVAAGTADITASMGGVSSEPVTITVSATSTAVGITVTLATVSTTDEGQNVTLTSVKDDATGNLVFTATPKDGTAVTAYAWMIDGEPVADESKSTYTITAAQLEKMSAGSHYVLLTVTIGDALYAVNTTFTITR